MDRIFFFVMLCVFSLQSCIKQDTITYQVQFKSDTASVGHFVRDNNIQAIKVNTGFWYAIDTLGNGVYPVLSDSVTIAYTAKLIPSLEEVDMVASTTVLLSSAISGLQQGLILFPATSAGRLYIPSGLAFGVSAHKQIPPNSNLLYEIKLISVKGTRFTSDLSAIDTYLQSHSIVAHYDDSDIRYTIDEIDSATSNAPKPVITDSILVTYSGRILNADTVVTSVNTPVKLPLKDQITGWRIMLPKYVAEGTKITMYIPSGYVYGSSVKGAIPANSNMVYEVTLIKVN